MESDFSLINAPLDDEKRLQFQKRLEEERAKKHAQWEKDPLAMRDFYEACVHCGLTGRLIIRASFKFEPDIDNGIYTDWILLQCIHCQNPLLYQYYSEDEGYSMLYPTQRVNSENKCIPQSVIRAYNEAIRVRFVSPVACAVMVGRALEAICQCEKAEGKTLAQKLDFLSNSGRIPQTFVEMAQQLRQIRNLGAHLTTDEIDDVDVNLIIDFLEAIIEYLYIAPSKLAHLQERLKNKDK